MKRTLRIESLESRTLLASDWQNPSRPLDVNADENVTALDVLVSVNRLNERNRSTKLPVRDADSKLPYYDVNGDGIHNALDVLNVINALNGGVLIRASLANDSGQGTQARSDRITNDPTIAGRVHGRPSSFQIRLTHETDWHDATEHLATDGTFRLSSDDLTSLLGKAIPDGDVKLDLSATRNQPRAISDRTVISFRLDRSPLGSSPIGDVLMDRSDRIVIPLSEPINSATLDARRVRLFDVSWGEGTTEWYLGTDGPRHNLVPKSVRVSPDGLNLWIEPPTATRSMRYLVELDSFGEDMAGNRFPSWNESDWSLRAHWFQPNDPVFEFGKTYRPTSPKPQVSTYQFTIDRDDTLATTRYTYSRLTSTIGFEF